LANVKHLFHVPLTRTTHVFDNREKVRDHAKQF
jgi:hypothetical protein